MSCERRASPVLLSEGEYDLYVDDTTGQSIPIRAFTWTNSNKVSIQVINYGATVISLKVPDKNGDIEDLVLGFGDLKGYRSADNPYFGATIGRVANRIGKAEVNIQGTIYDVTKNDGDNQLHGGFKGFDKVVWDYYVDGSKLILSYHSADLEEGYPGDVIAKVTYELTATNEFNIEYKAIATKPTVVNMTNHSYFNLAGHNKGAVEIYKHVVSINADRITAVDAEGIPSGVLPPVAGTAYDFQIQRVLGDVINRVPDRPGFDHNFCITKGPEQGITFIARVYHPPSGRVLEVYSDQPGVQFYTANGLPEDPNTFKGDPKTLTVIQGKDGNYYKHGAFCLETQNWPDAPNHVNFPNAILLPGETYEHYTSLRFSIKDD